MIPAKVLGEMQVLAYSLARREAHFQDDIDDLAQTALLAFVRAWKEVRAANDRFALARTVMQRAMWAYYTTRNVRAAGRNESLDALEGSHSLHRRGDRLQFVDMQESLFDADLLEYLDALMEQCGAQARRVVENLIAPEGECAASILAEACAKTRQQAQCARIGRRSHQPRGVKKGIRISHRNVREGLGLTPTEWDRAMRSIREFTHAYYDHNDVRVGSEPVDDNR